MEQEQQLVWFDIVFGKIWCVLSVEDSSMEEAINALFELGSYAITSALCNLKLFAYIRDIR